MSNQNVEQPEFLADVQKLKEQIDSLQKRLDLVEENREKVRQKIYEKVKSDYKKKLDEFFTELEPFKEKIDAEITGLEDRILDHQEKVENNQEILEEIQLRFFAGEFAEDEFGPRQTELTEAIDSSNASIKELEDQIKDYRVHLSFITGEPVEDDVPEEEAEEEEEEPFSPEVDAEDSDVAEEESLEEEAEAEEEEEELLEDGSEPEEFADEADADELKEDDELEEEEADEPAGEEEEEDFEEFKPESDEDDSQLLNQSEPGLMKDTVDSEFLTDDGMLIDSDDIVVADDEEEYEWSCIPILDVVDGDFTGESYTIDKERITMGRGPNNDIQLATDTSVSRHHAQIALEGTKYVLVDLESSNGTSVNGMRITRAVLKPNDELMIGQSKLIIRTQD